MDDMEQVSIAIDFGLPLFILIFAYLVGSFIEKKHFRQIQKRERALQGFPVTTF